VPAGVLAGTGVVSSYLFALHDLDFSVLQARTIATTVLVAVGLYLVLVLEAHGRLRSQLIAGMCAALAGVYVVVLVLPAARRFFDLAPLNAGMIATALVAAAISISALAIAGFTPGSGLRDAEEP
jgi:hypothetical protein